MKRYKKLKLAIVSKSLFSEGGDWRSVYFLAKHLELKGENIALISPRSKQGLKQTLAAFVFAPNLIFNGLNTLLPWYILILVLLRRDIAVYLHETSYLLDMHQKTNPLHYYFLSRIVRKNPVFCVSRQAEQLYKTRFGATDTHVVYECPGDAPDSISIELTKKNIIMVGTINERKGVELFSKVADLAIESHPDWQFHWVGPLATINQVYQSSNVTWHGWQWQPGKIVEQCDLFFLSSVDDPCPLSALEAMQAGLRIVAYCKTGTAEIIRDTAGCGVFEDYSAKTAMKSLDKALSATNDSKIIKDKAQAIAGVEAFSKRIEKAFAK